MNHDLLHIVIYRLSDALAPMLCVQEFKANPSPAGLIR